MLSHDQARAKLRRLIETSHLPRVVFFEWVLGVDRTTGQRYMRDARRIPACRRLFINSLRRVELQGDTLVIELSRGGANPRWNYYRLRSNRARYSERG